MIWRIYAREKMSLACLEKKKKRENPASRVPQRRDRQERKKENDSLSQTKSKNIKKQKHKHIFHFHVDALSLHKLNPPLSIVLFSASNSLLYQFFFLLLFYLSVCIFYFLNANVIRICAWYGVVSVFRYGVEIHFVLL